VKSFADTIVIISVNHIAAMQSHPLKLSETSSLLNPAVSLPRGSKASNGVANSGSVPSYAIVSSGSSFKVLDYPSKSMGLRMFDAAKSGRFDELKAMKACASQYSKYVESQTEAAKSSMRALSVAVGHGVGQHKSQIDPGGNCVNLDGHCLHAGIDLVEQVGVKILTNGVANSGVVNTNGVGGVVGTEQIKVNPTNGKIANAISNVNSTQQQTDTLQNTNESEPEPQRGGISVNGRCYLLCNTIGKGGSAEVFRVQALPTEGEEKERLDGIVSDLGAISSKTNSDDVAVGAISSKTNSDAVAVDSAAADSAAANSAAADVVNESHSRDLPTTDNNTEHIHDSGDCLQYLNKQRTGPIPHELYALKIVFARSQEEFDQFFNEVKLLYQCQNQHNVIQMLDFETNPSCFGIFMVMELASQGDLFHYLRDHADSLRLCGDPYILVEGGNASTESVEAAPGALPLAEDNEHNSETQTEETEKTEVNSVADSPAKIYIETNDNVVSENSEARPSENPSKFPGLNLSSVTAQFRPGSQIKVSLDDIADQTSIAPPEKRSLGSSSSQAKLHHSGTQSTRTPDLSHSCLRKEKISLEELDNRCRSVLSLFTQSLTGVRSLHEKKIIHSDLKPANFLVCEQAFRIDTSTVEGRSLAAFLGMPDDASTVMLSVVKVADLGLAAVVREGDSHVTRGNLIGTQQFMAPEAIFRMNEGAGAGIMEGVESDGAESDAAGLVGQMMRETGLMEDEQEPRFDKTQIRYASDVWSMGVILFLMMYQRTPYAHLRRLGQCLWMVMLDESVAIQFQPCMLGNVSQEFERLVQICQGCLQHKPSDRWNLDRIFEEIHRDLGKAPYELKFSPTLQVRGTGTLVEIKTLGKLNAVSAVALTAQSSMSTGNSGLYSASENKSTKEASNMPNPAPSPPISAAISPEGPASLTRGSGRADASGAAPARQLPSRNQRPTKRCDCRCVTVSIAFASTGIIGLIFGSIYGVVPLLRGGARETPGSLGGNDVTKDPSNELTEDNNSHENMTVERKTIQETHEKNHSHVNFKSRPTDSNDQKTLPSIDPPTSEENLETGAMVSKNPDSIFLKPVGNGRKKAKMLAAATVLGAGAVATALGLWGVHKHTQNTSQIADDHPGSVTTPNGLQVVLPQASDSSALSNDRNPTSVTTSPKVSGGLTGQPASNTTDAPTGLGVAPDELPVAPRATSFLPRLFTDLYPPRSFSDSESVTGSDKAFRMDLEDLLKFLRDSGNKTELAFVNATERLLSDDDESSIFPDSKKSVNVILKLLNQRAPLFQYLHGPRTREKARVSQNYSNWKQTERLFNGDIQSGQLSLLLASSHPEWKVRHGYLAALIARGVLWSDDFRALIRENGGRAPVFDLQEQDVFFEARANSDIATMWGKIHGNLSAPVPLGGTVLAAPANATHVRPQSIEFLSYLYHDLSSEWFKWCLMGLRAGHTAGGYSSSYWSSDSRYTRGLLMYRFAAREQLMQGGSFDKTSLSLGYRTQAASLVFKRDYLPAALDLIREEVYQLRPSKMPSAELSSELDSDPVLAGMDHDKRDSVNEVESLWDAIENRARSLTSQDGPESVTYAVFREKLVPMLEELLSKVGSGEACESGSGSAKLRKVLQTLVEYLTDLKLQTQSLTESLPFNSAATPGPELAAAEDIKDFALMFLYGGATVGRDHDVKSPWHEKAKPAVRTILDATRTLLQNVAAGYAQGVQTALDSRGNICARDENGLTAFQNAREKYLLSVDESGSLYDKSEIKRQKEHKLSMVEIIKLLKKEAAKKLKEGIEESDPLLVRCALEQGASEINFEDTQPLINAIQQGHEDIVSMLLNAGAKIVAESEVPGFDLVPDSVKAIIKDTAQMFEIATSAKRNELVDVLAKKAKIGARNQTGLDVFQIVAEAEEKHGTMPQRHAPPGNPRVAAYCHYFLKKSGLSDKFSMHTTSHEKPEKEVVDWINVLKERRSDPGRFAKHCNETLKLHHLPKEWNSNAVPNSGEDYDSGCEVSDCEPRDVDPPDSDVASDIGLSLIRMGIQDLESESFEYIYNSIDNDNYWNIPPDLRYGESNSESQVDRNSVLNMVKNLLALQRPGFKLSATKIVQMFAGGTLLDAVKSGDLFVAQRLINLGADCWIQDANGDSPLTIAVLKDYQDFFRPNMSSFLLPRGVFVDGILARIFELRAFISKDSNVEVKLLRDLDKPEKNNDVAYDGRFVLDLVARAFLRDRSKKTKKVGPLNEADAVNFTEWQVGDLVSDFASSEFLLDDSLFVWPVEHHDLALFLNLKAMESSLAETFLEHRDLNGFPGKLLMEWLQSPRFIGGTGRVVDNLKKVAEKFGDKELGERVDKLLQIVSGSV